MQPHTPKEIARWLADYGHRWGPANLQGVDDAAIAKMDGSESDYRAMVASWQQIDANVNRLVNAFHGRELEPDGLIGPASESVMGFARCAMPDYSPPPNASFHYDNPDLQAAVESQQRYAEATGSGSWPVGCDPQNPKVHSVVVGIDISNASSSQKSIMADCLKYVEETEAEIGQSVRHVLNPGNISPQHDVKFQNIPGNVIGFAYFPDPNTCRQTVVARIDNSFNARLAVLAELLTHEYKGHSDGLNHTNGGIMNASIGSPTARASWKNDPSFRTKKAYFGGEPISPPTPPTPPAHPPVTGQLFGEPFGSGFVIRGDVTFDGKWKYVATPDGSGKYKLVPKAEA